MHLLAVADWCLKTINSGFARDQPRYLQNFDLLTPMIELKKGMHDNP